MNSHEFANKLKGLAEFLLSKPEFETGYSDRTSYLQIYAWSDKEIFLDAVKALGAGAKNWGKDELVFIPSGTDMLRIQVDRSAVCRKVQEEKWECEPLLSQEEEASVGI